MAMEASDEDDEEAAANDDEDDDDVVVEKIEAMRQVKLTWTSVKMWRWNFEPTRADL